MQTPEKNTNFIKNLYKSNFKKITFKNRKYRLAAAKLIVLRKLLSYKWVNRKLITTKGKNIKFTKLPRFRKWWLRSKFIVIKRRRLSYPRYKWIRNYRFKKSLKYAKIKLKLRNRKKLKYGFKPKLNLFKRLLVFKKRVAKIKIYRYRKHFRKHFRSWRHKSQKYRTYILSKQFKSLKYIRLSRIAHKYVLTFKKNYNKGFQNNLVKLFWWRFLRLKTKKFSFLKKIKNIFNFNKLNLFNFYLNNLFTKFDKNSFNRQKKNFKLKNFFYFRKKLKMKNRKLSLNFKKLLLFKLFFIKLKKKLVFKQKFVKPIFKKRISKYFKMKRASSSFIRIITKKLIKFADLSLLYSQFFLLLEKYVLVKSHFDILSTNNIILLCSAILRKQARKYYNCYIKRSTNNFFITITNMIGEVYFSFSAGRLELFKKKKKRRNIVVLSYIFERISKILRKQFLITKIKNLFLSLRFKQAKRVYWLLKRRGFKISRLINILPRSHSNILYKKNKKLRRV